MTLEVLLNGWLNRPILPGGMLQTSGESFSNDDTSTMTSAAIEDKILSYGYTTNVGDITAVTAGDGPSGGATFMVLLRWVQVVTLLINANDVAVDYYKYC